MNNSFLDRRKVALPAVEELRENFRYNPETGELWRLWKSRRRKGDLEARICGSLNAKGYRITMFKGNRIKVHRLVWALVHGEWPPDCLDHINGNRADNRIENLRVVTNYQNSLNAKTRVGVSGVKGVTWDKRKRKWDAVIRANGKKNRVGRFKSLEDAVIAMRLARERLHGEYANHGEGWKSLVNPNAMVLQQVPTVPTIPMGCPQLLLWGMAGI